MKFIKIHEVSSLTSMSKSLIYKKVQEGTFPKQVKTSENSSAWIEEEVINWMSEKADHRSNSRSKYEV